MLLLSAAFTAYCHNKLPADTSFNKPNPVERVKYPPVIGERFPEDRTPSARQKQWALATGAILTEINNRSHDILGYADGLDPEIDKQTLKAAWRVNSREDLLNTLGWLESGGHRCEYDALAENITRLSPQEIESLRKHACELGGTFSNRIDTVLSTMRRLSENGIAGWDYSRYISLCNWAYSAGYIDEHEAWSLIMPVARLLQKSFPSWAQLSESFVEGRRFWSQNKSLGNDPALRKAIRFLRQDSVSPWSLLPWQLNLLPEEHADDGTEECRVGKSWYFGRGLRKHDTKACRAEAEKHFMQAVEKGNPEAMFWMGVSHWSRCGKDITKEDYLNVAEWFRRAADLRQAQAQYELARFYHAGLGVSKNPEKAAALMMQAVANGAGTKAEAFLGWCYEQGYGIDKSIEKAISLYKKCAESDEPWAQVNLGDCYDNGRGVEKDIYTAARWYECSAHGGNADGMCRWANALESGKGTTKNEAAAYAWYQKAAKAGSKKAQKRLEEIDKTRHLKPDLPAQMSAPAIQPSDGSASP